MDNMSDRAFKQEQINNVNKKVFDCFRRFKKIQNKHKPIFATVVLVQDISIASLALQPSSLA